MSAIEPKSFESNTPDVDDPFQDSRLRIFAEVAEDYRQDLKDSLDQVDNMLGGTCNSRSIQVKDSDKKLPSILMPRPDGARIKDYNYFLNKLLPELLEARDIELGDTDFFSNRSDAEHTRIRHERGYGVSALYIKEVNEERFDPEKKSHMKKLYKVLMEICDKAIAMEKGAVRAV